jgi:hypothetical protein
MSIELRDHERIWLEELNRRIAEGLPIDRRQMLIDLRTRLPKDFLFSSIDPRLLYGGGPSALGLLLLGSDNDILKDLERTIVYIRDCLIKDPNRTAMTDKELASDLHFPLPRAQRLLNLMPSVGGFFSGATPVSDNRFGYSEVNLTGDELPAEYLGFDDLENTLRSRLESQTPSTGTIASALASSSPRDSERDTAFILMNMDPKDPSLLDVLNAIKRVCVAFGVSAYRIDDVEHQDRITDRVLEMIQASELLIADLSGERPNVYYEVGYAHALGKRPILYRKTGTRLHFDLSVHNVPEYANVTELATKLGKRLEAVLGRSPKTPIE